MQRYSVVIFKNKVKKKIIKKFVTLETATNFYEKIKKDSDNVIFETKYENTNEVKYDLALIDSSPKDFSQTYLMDEFGRNIKVKLEDKNQAIVKISDWREEELIYDLQKKEKISIIKLLSNYLRNQNLKMVFTLNNKIVIQDDDHFYLFSLKNVSESERLLSILSHHCFKNKRSDCMFINDNSTPQKKFLYKLLEEKGWDKKVLYRNSTTFRAR